MGAPAGHFASIRTHKIELVEYGFLKVRLPFRNDRIADRHADIILRISANDASASTGAIATARLDESVGRRGALIVF